MQHKLRYQNQDFFYIAWDLRHYSHFKFSKLESKKDYSNHFRPSIDCDRSSFSSLLSKCSTSFQCVGGQPLDYMGFCYPICLQQEIADHLDSCQYDYWYRDRFELSSVRTKSFCSKQNFLETYQDNHRAHSFCNAGRGYCRAFQFEAGGAHGMEIHTIF